MFRQFSFKYRFLGESSRTGRVEKGQTTFWGFLTRTLSARASQVGPAAFPGPWGGPHWAAGAGRTFLQSTSTPYWKAQIIWF